MCVFFLSIGNNLALNRGLGPIQTEREDEGSDCGGGWVQQHVKAVSWGSGKMVHYTALVSLGDLLWWAVAAATADLFESPQCFAADQSGTTNTHMFSSCLPPALTHSRVSWTAIHTTLTHKKVFEVRWLLKMEPEYHGLSMQGSWNYLLNKPGTCVCVFFVCVCVCVCVCVRAYK